MSWWWAVSWWRAVCVVTGGGVGVTELLGLLGPLVPMLLVARTDTVYAVPVVSPVIGQVVAPVVVQLCPPGVAVAVYPVIGCPPVNTGATHPTTA